MGIKLRFTRTQVIEFEDEQNGLTPDELLVLNLRNANEMPEHVFDDAETTSIVGVIVDSGAQAFEVVGLPSLSFVTTLWK